MPGIRFGTFVWVDDGDRPLHQLYEDHLALAAQADEAGFFCFHMAEHHCTPLGLAPSPGVFLSAVARETTRIRLGPLVYLLPLYHPLRLVEEICMLDHLSAGRLELGVGRGVSPWELGHFGVDAGQSRRLFEEALTPIVAALRGDGTGFGRFGSAPIEVEPYQKPYPPLAYATTIPDSVRWAAEQGLNLAGLGPAAAYRPNTDLFWGIWEANRGRPDRLNAHVERPRVSLTRQLVVAETDAEAHQLLQAVHPRWAESFIALWEAHGDDTYRARTDLDVAVANDVIIAGSPATVRAALARVIEESGIDYVLCAFSWGSLTREQSSRSMRLFVDEVMPHLVEFSAGAGP